MDKNILRNNYHPLFKKKNFIRKILQFLFNPLGFYIVEKAEYGNLVLNRWDMNLPQIFTYLKKFFNNKVVIFDVGSHKGEIIYFFKELFNSSSIHCFEPQKNIFDELKVFIKTQKYNDVISNNFGLDKFDGVKKFYPASNTLKSSFIKSSNQNNTENNNSIDYPVFRGDNYSLSKKIKDIDILKINVQGMEMDVLKGFEKLLKSSNIKVVLAEYDYSNRYQSSSKIGDLENFLQKFNYDLFDIVLLRRKKIIDHNDNLWFLKIKHGYVIFVNKNINEKI